jgi:ABC-2 type transport system ATP-binding protein
VLESRSVHGGRSAYNHLLCLAQSNGIARSRVDAVLEIVGLTGVAHKRARTFSLGMSQRLGLAAALLGDPAVVMCDEPVNGLDPEGIRWIRTMLRGLAAEGRTVFVSSHLMSEMTLMADHVIVVGRGRLLADAGVDELLADGARSFALVRSPDGTRLEPVLRGAGATVRAHPDGGLEVVGLGCERIGDLAAEHGLRLHELTQRQASLEAAFLELTHDCVDFRVEEAS